MAEGFGRSPTEIKGPVRVTLVSACFPDLLSEDIEELEAEIVQLA